MKMIIGSIDFLTDAERAELIDLAKRYGENDFDTFCAEVGFCGWMMNYLPDGAPDDYELTEREVENIDIVLREAFRIAHE